MRKFVIPLLALAATPALAMPFANGDTAKGKALYASKCAGCHISMFGGDGSKIFTRPDHRNKTASALAQQITTCNANLGNQLFPEDEENLGAYLNKQYYKFK